MAALRERMSLFIKRFPLRAFKYSVFASAGRTATPTAVEIEVDGHKGVEVYVNITAVTSTPSTTFAIDSWDEITQAYVNLVTSAAQAGVATVRLTVYPGAPVSANVSANANIRNKIRIAPVHGNANSMTYTVDACFLP
jgi:hypothetical protein